MYIWFTHRTRYFLLFYTVSGWTSLGLFNKTFHPIVLPLHNIIIECMSGVFYVGSHWDLENYTSVIKVLTGAFPSIPLDIKNLRFKNFNFRLPSSNLTPNLNVL